MLLHNFVLCDTRNQLLVTMHLGYKLNFVTTEALINQNRLLLFIEACYTYIHHKTSVVNEHVHMLKTQQTHWSMKNSQGHFLTKWVWLTEYNHLQLLDPKVTTDYKVTYPLNLYQSGIESKCRVWWNNLTNTSSAITKMRRDGDPPSLPETHVNESTVHASNDASMAQRYNVWSIVIKAVQRQNTSQAHTPTF